MESLSFLIPAYNDQATIRDVVTRADAAGKHLKIPYRIIITNDGSTDQTASVLSSLKKDIRNLTIITHQHNAGYGKTMKELYRLTTTTWLFTVPGDFQIDPREVMKLWQKRDNTDMIIGWRTHRKDNAARLRQSAFYNGLLRFLFHTALHDINSVRLTKTSLISHVAMHSTSAFVDAELTINAIRGGFRVKELPIAHRARAGTGASGGKLSVILPTIKDLLFYLK